MVKFDRLLYGGDYNPDQWLEHPEILEKDIELMRASHINTVSVGIFAWAALEPEEGVFRFEWMENIVDKLYRNGVSVILATPSGARPKWLADKYPEVLRVDETGHRAFFGGRHNHCYTSPVYREKVKIINQELARRLGKHPGVRMWHISNEYGGACYCPLCQQEFRVWLKDRYGTIDEVNRRWNTAFWSHQYQSFDQIEAPSVCGEMSVHGLTLDWKRFVTDRTADFMRFEIECLREAGSDKPATTNMMYNYDGLNYHKMAPYLDVISWDTYPTWHKGPEADTALDCAMQHDIMRSLKKQPFILMESCPSSTNWQPVSKLKKPGMLRAASLEAVAHGSDSVLYFQFRASRGSSEKFHGAVVDQYGGSDTRVFREATATGAALDRLQELAGTQVSAQAAVIYDWENRWAMEDAQGPRNRGLFYKETVEKSYKALRALGLDVDVIDMEQDLDGYRFVAVPMLYMFRAGFEEKLRRFVEQGGTAVMTYWSGIVDENDLCFLGRAPHGLTDVLGLRRAEIDGLYDGETNTAVPLPCQNYLTHTYECRTLCELVEVPGAKSSVRLGDAVLGDDLRQECAGDDGDVPGDGREETYGSVPGVGQKTECAGMSGGTDAWTRGAEGAQVLAVYGSDFYAGTPALTRNPYGKGQMFYVCADFEQAFYHELYGVLAREAGLALPPVAQIPRGVEVTQRTGSDASYLIIQNFGDGDADISLTDDGYQRIYGNSVLKKYETAVYRKKRRNEP